jgi:hypothetical protein
MPEKNRWNKQASKLEHIKTSFPDFDEEVAQTIYLEHIHFQWLCWLSDFNKE